MKERPILFSGAMVRALLDGRKTQTRRVVKGVPSWDHYGRDIMDWGLSGIHQETYDQSNPIVGTDRWHLDVQTDVDDHSRRVIRCPYGAPGDRLWVRETCQAVERPCGDDGVHYPADGGWVKIENSREAADRWCDLLHYGRREQKRALAGPNVPAIHMPRWASRITLEIADVRVERLQAISEADADAEGFGGDYPDRVMPDVFPPREGGWGHLSIPECYRHLWEHINGADSWDANPFVWVVEFTRLTDVERAAVAA